MSGAHCCAYTELRPAVTVPGCRSNVEHGGCRVEEGGLSAKAPWEGWWAWSSLWRKGGEGGAVSKRVLRWIFFSADNSGRVAGGAYIFDPSCTKVSAILFLRVRRLSRGCSNGILLRRGDICRELIYYGEAGQC